MSTRFSSADAAWLHMDRPTNLMVINTVLLFDEPVDWQRVRQLTQERMVDAYPRFRQRAVESRLPLRPPKWVDDTDFALEHHMHHLALPAPGDTATLQELVSDLMTMPLDRSRPLWHTYMIDGLGDGAAMICRMHHCIADGIALARVMLSLTDAEPDAGIGPLEEWRGDSAPRGLLPDIAGSAVELVSGVGRIGSAAVRQGVDLVRSPAHAARLAGAIGRDAGTAVRLVLTPADAATAIKGDPGISRRVSWSEPLSLAEVKQIAHSHKATVNDVLLAAVSGALRHYLQERGGPVAEVQAMVPFNLRPLDQPVPRKLGNKFGLVFLPLPVGTSGSYRRLLEVHRRMEEIKNGRDGPVSYGLLSVTGMTPEPLERKIIDMFTAKTTAVMTNVPGPREPVYLAGTPVRSAIVWAPTSGHMGMSVSIFSYRGEVTVGLMTDAALIPDPAHITDSLEREVQSLSRPGHARRRTPARRQAPARR
ncbi:MAG TPA: wax ester/triacylglycerol synthase family O-acyltransferase [Solirubrobacteraceae bacterium]|nr:wax ester/triacylglycerol synthase family O-acyltransferase [Solirubrobacteraceae bacterium]